MIDRAKEPIRYATEVVGGDPFAAFLGIRIDDVKDSYARLSLSIKPEYCNSEQRSHGGALFTLADQAFAVAANTKEYVAFAMEIKINYLQAARSGETVSAVATPIDIRKRVSLWNVEITNENRDKIAVAQGLAYHFV